MLKFEIDDKRHNFRLEIRRKHLQQKFAHIRNKYNQNHFHQNHYPSSIPIQINYQSLIPYKQSIKDLLSKLYQYKLNRQYQCIINEMYQFINIWKIKENANGELKHILTLCMDEILYNNGDKIIELSGKQRNEQEFFENDDQQEQQYYEEDFDSEYDKIMIKNKKKQDCKQKKIEINEQELLSILNLAIQVISSLELRIMKVQSIIYLIRILWNILLEALDLQVPQDTTLNSYNHQKQQKHRYIQLEIITNIFNIISKATSSNSLPQNYQPFNKLIIDVLECLGLHQKLIQIIDYSIEFDTLFKHTLSQPEMYEKNHENYGKAIISLHMNLLQILQNLTSNPISREQSNFQNLPFNTQIHPPPSDNEINIYQHYLAYGLYLLNSLSLAYNPFSQQPQCYFLHQLIKSALMMLINMMKDHKELVGSIEEDNYRILIEILNSNNYNNYTHNQNTLNKYDEISLYILKLFKIVTTDQQCIIDTLISNYNIIPILYNQIKNIPYTFTNDNSNYKIQANIKICTDILNNLMHTHNKNIKKQMYNHPIFQYIFNLLIENTNNFMYFFEIFPMYLLAFGRKTAIKNMHIFLQLAKRLQLGNKYNEKISRVRHIVQQIYQNCRNVMNQYEIEIIINLYQTYGLLQYIENNRNIEQMDLMD